MKSITLTIGEHEVTIDEQTPKLLSWAESNPDTLARQVLILTTHNYGENPTKRQIESQIATLELDL